jgi:hypothetical protein
MSANKIGCAIHMDVRDIFKWACRPATVFLLSALVVLAGSSLALADDSQQRDVQTPTTDTSARPHPRTKTYMKRQWGIEIVFVRQTAAGYMLEFRYKVIDAEKAAPLFERQTKPLLTHTESGAKLIVPTPAKTGALRNSDTPLVDHTYWMFFANPGQLVQPGEHVNIAIGDFRADNLIVQ